MKILIIKLGALGDVIISTSIIKKISEHHITDNIYLLTSPQYAELFSHFNNIKIISFERKGLINKLKTLHWIRKNKFDRLYDLQSNDISSIYCAFSGTPYRAGNHPRYPYNIHPNKAYKGECHSYDRLNQIIEQAKIPPAQPTPYLPTSKKTVNEVNSWLKKHDLLERPFVLFHAGSSPIHTNKRWPFFKELANKLKPVYETVWVGGKDDVNLNRAFSADIGIDATNLFNIFSLVELGKKAKFAVTNDSAPMHILSCSKIPVFGLFGPTYPRRTHALGQRDNIISVNKQMAVNDRDFVPSDISKISLEHVVSKLQEQNLL